VSIEDLFLAGLGFDIAGAYLVSRGLLQNMLQLASAGGTIWSMERPRVTYAVDDRIRGSVGLVSLVLGFSLQVVGYVAVLDGSKITHGHDRALIGATLAVGIALLLPLAEARLRPRWRDRKLIRIARFDFEGGPDRKEKPLAHLLRSFGEETSRPALDGEDDVAYCARVFGVEAEGQD
jgi:hypothetical protein